MSVVNLHRRADAAEQRPRQPARLGATLGAYLALCKPRIVELLLITAVPTLFLAYRGLPSLLVTAVVVIGGALAAGSANALNCYIDRDIDELMRRTSGRPLVTHTVAPRAALAFGIVLGVVSVTLFAVTTNLLAAGLTLAAILYYVVIYTMLLKRHTAQSTLWGGVCGAAPVLIAWAAARGSLSVASLLLFAVVFFWQPPHFWALAIKYRDDYRSAGIPMLPVVAPVRRVLAESVVDSWLMVAASLALWRWAGPVYGGVAAVLGAVFLSEVHRLYHAARGGASEDRPVTMRLFHLSLVYLTLLFAAVAVGAVVR
ncbi:heme o synthase [Trebonia sp.]|uniref:heme o synthase n=1 Tax=Trebonia sp. TaxID=2767075 RepID=UPI00260624B3|nr:heme o synthase [Trebonia sp.]